MEFLNAFSARKIPLPIPVNRNFPDDFKTSKIKQNFVYFENIYFYMYGGFVGLGLGFCVCFSSPNIIGVIMNNKF